MADSGGGSLPGPKYRVSPNGSDNADGLTTPWQTLEGARRRIRQLIGITRSAQINVIVDPGDYWSPLAFDPGDGGLGWNVQWATSGAPGSVKVYGGAIVSGWQSAGGSIWKTRTVGRVTTMWENGTRARNARFPAYASDGTHPLAFGPYLTTEGVNGSTTVAQYVNGDLTPGSWTGETRLAIWPGGGGRAWFKDDRVDQSINVPSRQITLATAATYPVFNATGCRYYIEGDISFIVGAGQFISRLEGNQWWLYYWPTATPIGNQQIVIPAVDNVLSFQGDSLLKPIANLTIDGWDIQFSDGPYTFGQNASDYPTRDRGLVRMQYARGLTLRNCNIRNGGCVGVQWLGNVRNCTIERSWIHGTAAQGVFSYNYPGVAPDEGDVNNGNVIKNVKVTEAGEVFGTGCVTLFNTGNNMIDHCELGNAVRAGIEVNSGGGLGAKNYNHDNRIQYTSIHDVAQDSGDIGAAYVGQTGDSPNLANYWNQINIVNVTAHASMTDLAPNGFMYDDNGANQIVSNVNVTNSAGALARNHSGGSSTETNVAWVGGFIVGNMAADIGVLSGFPY